MKPIGEREKRDLLLEKWEHDLATRLAGCVDRAGAFEVVTSFLNRLQSDEGLGPRAEAVQSDLRVFRLIDEGWRARLNLLLEEVESGGMPLDWRGLADYGKRVDVRRETDLRRHGLGAWADLVPAFDRGDFSPLAGLVIRTLAAAYGFAEEAPER